MADPTYQPKCYQKQGGDELVIASGGKQTVEAGGMINSEGGADTSTAAASTINAQSGVITTEALTTAAGADYTFTLTNSLITAATANLMVQALYGSATAGVPHVVSVTPAAGSAVIVVRNIDAAAAFNGTLKLQFNLVTQ